METHLSRLWVFATFQNVHSKFTWQLDGNKWNDQWGTGSIIALPHFHPLLVPSTPPPPCQPLLPSLLFSPLVSHSFLPFDNFFSQICYCHRVMSHCFQPPQPPLPSCHPTPPPTFSLPPASAGSFCPLTVFALLLSVETQFPTLFWPALNSLSSHPHLSSQLHICCHLLFCFCFRLLLLLQRLWSSTSSVALLSGTIREV